MSGTTRGSTGSDATSRQLAPSSGDSSMMTWALVPLMPNDDTPARRGRPLGSQGWGSVSRSTRPAVQSTWGDAWSAWSVRGSCPWRSAMTILMTPATPAAAEVWPMLDLIDPSHRGTSRSCP
jgi:hypothetical protein